MRGSQVIPYDSDALETLAEEFAFPPVEVVAVVDPQTIGKVPSMIAALLNRPAKGGSSPVLRFGKSTVCVTIDGDDGQSNTAKPPLGKENSKTLLSGGAMRTRATQPTKSSVVRRLFRQEHSMPGRQSECEPTPLRRCISAGGCTSTTTSSASSSGGNLVRPGASKASAAASIASSSSGSRSSASSGPNSASSNGSLEGALQSLTQAASTTASALSSARQQHEEALQRQREQFQLMMETMRARSAAPRSPGEATVATEATARPSQSSATPTSSPLSAPATASAAPESPSPYRSPPPPPTSIAESYRGVQFSIPLGCRIEDGEGPSEVLVTGPQIDVVLEFRDGGRNVLLVSSNCVCTVKRMAGRIHVNVLPPLAVRSA